MPYEWYEIRVQGYLPSDWSFWFEGLDIRYDTNGQGIAIMSGPLADQAALHGVLAKIRNLNLTLISVCRRSEHPGEDRP